MARPKHMNWINGHWKEGEGPVFQSINPSNERIIWEGRSARDSAIQTAIVAAKKALNNWMKMPFNSRIARLDNIREQLVEKKDDLATLISKETGKPMWESQKECAGMINKIQVSIDAFTMRCPTMEHPIGSAMNRTYYKPHGVLAVIGPFNFPGHLPFGQIIPALLAGNTVLFKPSDKTPFVGEMLTKLIEQADLPVGTFQLLQGDAQTGSEMVGHPGIDGILFTGSAKVGRAIQSQLRQKVGKIVALEMGGNNPLIIESVSHQIQAIKAIIQSAFITSGQRCSCARRLIMMDTKQNRALFDELIKQIPNIKMGTPFDSPEPFMGPLISKQAQEHAFQFQSLCQSNGGTLIKSIQVSSSGFFCSPALIDMTHSQAFIDDECFAPILQMTWVNSFEDAIEQANRTDYGLSASIFTENRDIFYDGLHAIRAGIINWNAPTTGASSRAPFGGWGRSGNFRPGGFFTADSSCYPVASTQNKSLTDYTIDLPGLEI